MDDQLKIGELAERAGCLVETVRFYERKGLLPSPSRSNGNYRLYGEKHVVRLQFVRHCRSLDMSLDEIEVLLNFRDQPELNCAGVDALLDQHIEHVAARIGELKALQFQLKLLRSQCDSAHSTKECGILQGLTDVEESTASKSLGSHHGGCH